MSGGIPCEQRSLVEGHFGAGLSPNAEALLRQHLSQCEACHSAYERHLLFERLDPRGAKPKDRLARALGFRSRGAAGRPWFSLAIPAGVALAAASLLFVVHVRSPLPDGFSPRGLSQGPPPIELRVYEVHQGRSSPVSSIIPSHAELAFAFANRTARKYLMVYGVDEHRHVYWFYPSWTDPQTNPAAIPIADGPDVHELPEAISHTLDGSELRIDALYLDQPLTVREIESQIAAAPGGKPSIAGALSQSVDLKVQSP